MKKASITRKFYLLAQEIVKEYENQFHKATVSGSLQLDSGLKRNDYVTYIGGRETQYLVKGNKYRLTGTLWGNDRLRISVENDNRKRYVTYADCFKLQIKNYFEGRKENK